MGWFVIASIFGFWSYLYFISMHARRRLIVFPWLPIIMLVGLMVWGYLSDEDRSIKYIIHDINSGQVSRFLLGLVLGAGLAFVIRVRSFPGGRGVKRSEEKDKLTIATHKGEDSTSEAPKPDRNLSLSETERDAQPDTGALPESLPTSFVLPVGALLVVLALVAPHADRWLATATGVKSPVLELQWAPLASHKLSVSENLDYFYDQSALDYLSEYDKKIAQDISYLESFDRDTHNKSDILASAKVAQKAFQQIISPSVTCMHKAISEQWISLEDSREILENTIRIFSVIVFGQGTITQARQAELNEEFWKSLIDADQSVVDKVFGKSINDTALKAATGNDCKLIDAKSKDVKDAMKIDIQSTQNAPYLYLAGALLTGFYGDNDKALRILQRGDATKANKNAGRFEDYVYLDTYARLSFYQGRPADIGQTYLPILERMRMSAKNRQAILEGKGMRCLGKIDDLVCREKLAELRAINDSATFISEDIARNSKFAKIYMENLRDYADSLESFINNYKLSDGKGLYSSSLVGVFVPRFKDTHAYALLVLEASKQSPDYDMIDKKVIQVLEQVLGEYENMLQPKEKQELDKGDFIDWKLANAHLASAKGFVNNQ